MHVKDKSRNQERLERIIAKYKANEEAILKEQVLIADERVLTVRKEMQLEIDRLTIQISVYLEKITKKDADMRKLYIKIDNLNRSQGAVAELKRKFEIDIRNEALKYQSIIEELRVKLAVHERHGDYMAEIDRLKKIIQDLQWEIQQLKSRTVTVKEVAREDSDYQEEYDEKFEVVEVQQVARGSLQFDRTDSQASLTGSG